MEEEKLYHWHNIVYCYHTIFRLFNGTVNNFVSNSTNDKVFLFCHIAASAVFKILTSKIKNKQ